MKKTIIISTGGTGGHVLPALNLYSHLKSDFDVSLYTDTRGIKYIPKEFKKTIFEVKKNSGKKISVSFKNYFFIFCLY